MPGLPARPAKFISLALQGVWLIHRIQRSHFADLPEAVQAARRGTGAQHPRSELRTSSSFTIHSMCFFLATAGGDPERCASTIDSHRSPPAPTVQDHHAITTQHLLAEKKMGGNDGF